MMFIRRLPRVSSRKVVVFLKRGLVIICAQTVLTLAFILMPLPWGQNSLEVADKTLNIARSVNKNVPGYFFKRDYDLRFNIHLHANGSNVKGSHQQAMDRMRNNIIKSAFRSETNKNDLREVTRRSQSYRLDAVSLDQFAENVTGSNLNKSSIVGYLQEKNNDAAIRKQALASYLQKPRERVVLSTGCPKRDFISNRTSLVFVKVHKSASSTVANLLARYALRHALDVALPKKEPYTTKFNYFEPEIVRDELFPLPPGHRYQVLFNHMIFHRRNLQTFMPQDTFYFAIMRNPEHRFISSFFYYRADRHIKKLFKTASAKEAFVILMNNSKLIQNFTEIYNSLAGDTGLDPRKHRDESAIWDHIHRLEKDLHLIMVVEYFEESLVLLKRKACLSMQDLLYRVKNSRSPRRSLSLTLTEQERTSFRNFQKADFIMYDYFYQKFWNLVYAQKKDFFLEVKRLKEIQKSVEDFCMNVVSSWDFVAIARSQWNEEFMVTARDCRLMAMSELEMQVYLIDRAVNIYLMNGGNIENFYL